MKFPNLVSTLMFFFSKKKLDGAVHKGYAGLR